MSATAPAATPPRAAGRSPAGGPWRRRSARCSRPTSRPTPRRHRPLVAQSLHARVARRRGAETAIFSIPPFPTIISPTPSNSDIDALYAFLMTRPAVQARAPANRLKEPFGFRPLLAGWNLLFLHKGPLADDPGQSADWNRGRALAEGLAHCGGCHTPRNELGAERSDHAYDGAWTEGWYAPPLNASSPAVRPWTAEALFAYLRTGLSATHAAAAGPMGSVTRGLAAGFGGRCPRDRRLFRLADGKRPGRARARRRQTRATSRTPPIPRPPLSLPAPAPPATGAARR